ncbi:hypothetical protein EJ110_NYTH05732 [Nymphaea thermarum]|nr:hypothetical protein EJ110_NYTH05732 [Nymphaea thermarum]
MPISVSSDEKQSSLKAFKNKGKIEKGVKGRDASKNVRRQLNALADSMEVGGNRKKVKCSRLRHSTSLTMFRGLDETESEFWIMSSLNFVERNVRTIGGCVFSKVKIISKLLNECMMGIPYRIISKQQGCLSHIRNL